MLRFARRRGTLYIAVLGTSMLVTVIGLSALLAVQAQRRAARGDVDFATARLHAQAAIDLGVLAAQRDPAWRSKKPNGLWFGPVSVGNGTVSLYGQDRVDGDLADSASEPLVFTGVGEVGASRYLLEVQADPVVEPLDVLRTCLHAGVGIHVRATGNLTVSGGPLSTNGAVNLDGSINGNVEAGSVDAPGRVNGTVTAPAPTKAMPDPGVVALYQSRCTPIAPLGTFEKTVLSRGSNPWGTINGDGAYYIDCGTSNVTLRGMRLYGTLVIRCGKATFSDDILFQPYRTDYPVLIVEGDAEFSYETRSNSVGEAEWSTNFNPSGSPYGGSTDNDTTDTYPCEIQGLVYVTGAVTFSESAGTRGVVICNGNMDTNATNTLVYDDQPFNAPPEGFTQTSSLILRSGSFRRVLTAPN
jgi:hypothetical protein